MRHTNMYCADNMYRSNFQVVYTDNVQLWKGKIQALYGRNMQVVMTCIDAVYQAVLSGSLQGLCPAYVDGQNTPVGRFHGQMP
jgi:hypothetical protein